MMVLHERFDNWRKEEGLTLKELAAVAGVSSGAISFYRRQGRPYRADWIARWIDYYLIPLSKIGELFFEIRR